MSAFVIFFFKQKTAYEMRIKDWSSDVCSSDLPADRVEGRGTISQEKAEQGRGSGRGISCRMPGLCPAMGEYPARAIEAPRHRRRLGPPLSDDGFRRRSDHRARADEIRRKQPALSRRQAADVVPGRKNRPCRSRGRI